VIAMINNVVNVSSGKQPTGSLFTGSDVTQSGASVQKTAAPSAALKTQEAEINSSDVRAAVSKLNDHVQNLRRNLAFSIDDTTGQTIIRVYDSETNELIREIPSEETLRIAANIEAQHLDVFLKGQHA